MPQIILSSSQKGPIVGVVIFTHGNEIVGDEIKNFLKNISLNSGEIRIITANPLANEKFQKQDNPFAFRFIDHDLNRIWNDDFVENSYECGK